MTLDQLKEEFYGSIFEWVASEIHKKDIGKYTDQLIGIFEKHHTLTGALSDKSHLSGHCAGWCNTYPFGVPTSKVYSLLLAVCEEKTRLGSVLKYITAHCQNEFADPSIENKTVVMFTTKWDKNIFKKYEAGLLRFSVTNNIRIIFLLVTDYGITEIPFGWFCGFLQRREIDLSELDSSDGYSELIEIAKRNGIVRFYRDQGTWRPHDNEYIYIDFNNRTYYHGGMPPSGNIEPDMFKKLHSDIEQFARATSFVSKWKKSYVVKNMMDAGRWSLECFGRHYEGSGDFPKEFDRFYMALRDFCQ